MQVWHCLGSLELETGYFKANTMFLLNNSYWHSALPIDHISSFRRWELTETHTGQHTENERFWNSLFCRGSLHQTSPFRARELCRRGEKIVRGREDGRLQWNSVFQVHMNSHRLWQRAQRPHGFKSDRVPMLTGWSRHDLPFLIPKLSAIDTCKKLVFSNGVPHT